MPELNWLGDRKAKDAAKKVPYRLLEPLAEVGDASSDFVAELTDGRLFAVEYKGGDRYSNDDSKEKRDIGSVWAAASSRRCVFAMVTDAATGGASVAAQLRQAIKK